MGNCCSSPPSSPTDPLPTSRVPQQPQSNGPAFELQPGPSLRPSVLPRVRDTTSEPPKPVQSVESIAVPTPPPKISQSRSANPHNDSAKVGRPPVSYGETSQTRIPQSGIANPLSSPRYGPRSKSANPLYDAVRNEFLPPSGAAAPSPFE